jgi:hypothetical protein
MRRKLFGSGSPDWYDLGNLESGPCRVIDNQDEVERLLRELTKAMPLSALATPALMANLREQSSTANITLDCKVTKVINAGDEGGVICHLAFDAEDKEEVFQCQSPILPLITGSQSPARLRRTRNITSSTSDAMVRPTLPPPTTSGRSSLQPERPKHPAQYTNE